MSGLYAAAWPVIRCLDPETAHGLAIRALAWGLVSGAGPSDPMLRTEALGLRFAHPIGLAAGFDKSAEAVPALMRAGFGFVEVGSVTPRPQPGNPKPRLFRLEAERAVINRMGFNNDGAEAVAARLKRLTPDRRPGVLGVNLGKNKDTEDPIADYVAGARTFAALADYLVVNVSSPNTPGLRDLQGADTLRALLSAVGDAIAEAAPAGRAPPPLLVKVAPDLTDADVADVAAVCLEVGVDGLIATNTTVARPDTLTGPAKAETGGLSGAPLFEPSTRILARFRAETGGALTLIGAGGVGSGAEAYAKIRAGASLVQLYSALVYEGPGLAARVARDLAVLLKADGFASPAEAVGADA
jgi:dihydroorotate dehydrogenase